MSVGGDTMMEGLCWVLALWFPASPHPSVVLRLLTCRMKDAALDGLSRPFYLGIRVVFPGS